MMRPVEEFTAAQLGFATQKMTGRQAGFHQRLAVIKLPRTAML